MKAPSTFEELTGGNKELAKEISDLYGGDIEKVDLQVGMLSEPLPKGFGFSDTAFRIFILMASRRLKSDRFLSSDFKPEIYTKPGMEWVQNNTMKDVLIRHYPELRAPLRNVKNAFRPWAKVWLKSTQWHFSSGCFLWSIYYWSFWSSQAHHSGPALARVLIWIACSWLSWSWSSFPPWSSGLHSGNPD